jgi:hypothetical protein
VGGNEIRHLSSSILIERLEAVITDTQVSGSFVPLKANQRRVWVAGSGPAMTKKNTSAKGKG